MSQCKEKTTCVFFRSLFDAAERIHETNPETAYEIYRSYFRYAFCETEDIETDDMVAELLVRQNVESLNAADERYSNAVKNGEKGKEYGILGKEYGKLGGRPRKGETREEYWERRKKDIQKTPQKTPLTIATAITTSEASTYSSSISEDNGKKVTTNTNASDEENKKCTNEELRYIYINSFGEFMNNYPALNYSLLKTNNQDTFYDCYQDIVNELIIKIKNKSGRESINKMDVLIMLNEYLDYINYSYQ